MTAADFNPSTHAIVRCASHRSRQKLQQVCGEQVGFYSWETSCTGGFQSVPLEHLDIVLKITGCSRASGRHKYHRCWSNVH
jgi:hypothetical protein